MSSRSVPVWRDCAADGRRLRAEAETPTPGTRRDRRSERSRLSSEQLDATGRR